MVSRNDSAEMNPLSSLSKIFKDLINFSSVFFIFSDKICKNSGKSMISDEFLLINSYNSS